jgi:hypothetical protein
MISPFFDSVMFESFRKMIHDTEKMVKVSVKHLI